MGIVELFLTGVGLSMDAFAVAICHGLSMPKLNLRHGAVIALFFGGFQALMPLIGWLLGSQFAGYIRSFDHWIAFFLLAAIGANMVREAFSPEEEETCDTAVLDFRRLFLLALATSIDALAVGVTFAFYEEVSILKAIAIIGCTTFCISLCGVVVGNFFGNRYQQRAEVTGGVILILLGLKILLEDLGLL